MKVKYQINRSLLIMISIIFLLKKLTFELTGKAPIELGPLEFKPPFGVPTAVPAKLLLGLPPVVCGLL